MFLKKICYHSLIYKANGETVPVRFLIFEDESTEFSPFYPQGEQPLLQPSHSEFGLFRDRMADSGAGVEGADRHQRLARRLHGGELYSYEQNQVSECLYEMLAS